MVAARRGNELLVKLLLDKGADANVQDKTGSTALKYAQEGNFSKIAELLLERMSLKN